MFAGISKVVDIYIYIYLYASVYINVLLPYIHCFSSIYYEYIVLYIDICIGIAIFTDVWMYIVISTHTHKRTTTINN